MHVMYTFISHTRNSFFWFHVLKLLLPNDTAYNALQKVKFRRTEAFLWALYTTVGPSPGWSQVCL